MTLCLPKNYLADEKCGSLCEPIRDYYRSFCADIMLRLRKICKVSMDMWIYSLFLFDKYMKIKCSLSAGIACITHEKSKLYSIVCAHIAAKTYGFNENIIVRELKIYLGPNISKTQQL
jgi:hypothetical protein